MALPRQKSRTWRKGVGPHFVRTTKSHATPFRPRRVLRRARVGRPVAAMGARNAQRVAARAARHRRRAVALSGLTPMPALLRGQRPHARVSRRRRPRRRCVSVAGSGAAERHESRSTPRSSSASSSKKRAIASRRSAPRCCGSSRRRARRTRLPRRCARLTASRARR